MEARASTATYFEMAIYLMRNPETIDASDRCIGQTALPLSKAGEESIPILVAEAMEVVRPDAVLSSDLKQCQALSLAIYAAGVAIWTQDPVWRDINFGRWEGRSWNEICHRERATHERWLEDIIETAPPGGESYRDLHRRAWFACDQLESSDMGNVIVVTHAGVIRSLLSEGRPDTFSRAIPFGGIFEMASASL